MKVIPVEDGKFQAYPHGYSSFDFNCISLKSSETGTAAFNVRTCSVKVSSVCPFLLTHGKIAFLILMFEIGKCVFWNNLFPLIQFLQFLGPFGSALGETTHTQNNSVVAGFVFRLFVVVFKPTSRH